MISENLKKLLEKQEINAYTLSKETGITSAVIGRYLKGQNPEPKNLIKIADFFDVSTDYLLGRETTFKSESIPEFVYLPLFVSPVSAGSGEFLTDSEQFENAKFNQEDVPNNADFALTIRGDSMEPEYYEGDIVFVRKNVFPDPYQVGVFCLNGKGYIKRLKDGMLVSNNPKYKPRKIYPEDSFYIIGRVVGEIPNNTIDKS
jgi:phage repressor protein C with HTH and peptisase S24 domain